MGEQFARTFCMSTILGEMQHQLAAIGNTSSKIINRMDSLIIKAAKIVLGTRPMVDPINGF